ncbi:DUF432 domain-containing protein [Candidatus Nitrosopumilus sediminis]|uniref:DUF432 domain-containing protein n=1 Tax=Candidatus Nitrosopumilus sediminis TaxID=1229909 RepID=K0B9T0_9ARCH|nr:DUF432 domain-containing protein [Candidatus Nitrosopumilus sediminis]AFS82923.1 hypothetical protein NSED_05605 [Candidatus Nitrosopumilus sediminis]
MTEETIENTFSNYGLYDIGESLELNLPGTEIRIRKISENVFSYSRKNFDDDLIEKIIPINSSKLQIELCPIRPLNYPARRTAYMYLDVETPIFLSENSAATVFLRCPIEIGVFFIHDNHKDSLDCFTCDPINSRFCLYGSPESGSLCKYAKSEIVESYDDSIPFVNGVLKVNLKNDLSKGLSISRIVFPISDNSIYYQDSHAILDSLNAVLKKKLTLEIIDVVSEKIQTSFTLSPTYEKIETVKHMDMGVE